MKDKVKGIFIGLAIGTLLTGATAAAAGTNINVVIKKLTMYVDGTKKLQLIALFTMELPMYRFAVRLLQSESLFPYTTTICISGSNLLL